MSYDEMIEILPVAHGLASFCTAIQVIYMVRRGAAVLSDDYCLEEAMRKFAVILAAIWLIPGSAFAVGAIAVDDHVGETDPYYGFSIGEGSQRAAENSAVGYCRRAGGRNCKAIVWFETCGAYAASRKYYGYGYGATKAKATADALQMCGRNSCQVIVAECEKSANYAAPAAKQVPAPQSAQGVRIDGVWRSTSGNSVQIHTEGNQVFVTLIDTAGRRNQGSGRWIRAGQVFDYSLPDYPGVATCTVVNANQISVSKDGKVNIWQRN